MSKRYKKNHKSKWKMFGKIVTFPFKVLGKSIKLLGKILGEIFDFID